KKKSKEKDENEDDEDEEKSKVTLSGLLNFTDDLWSSTGSERILIVTPNHIEELDPALWEHGYAHPPLLLRLRLTTTI
ncbi:hypothetical protein SELMODRAFT_77521, partial [Selaginella moellendorffii]